MDLNTSLLIIVIVLAYFNLLLRRSCTSHAFPRLVPHIMSACMVFVFLQAIPISSRRNGEVYKGASKLGNFQG